MPWSASPVLIYRPGLDASGVWKRHISPAWDYLQPTSADVQVDVWWRFRFLSPYTNMCSPLYWMTFFRHRFLSQAGMQRKTIAYFHKTKTDSKLLMGQLQGQVSQLKCTQANKTQKTCDDCWGIAVSSVYIKCLYLQMRIHDSAVKLLYWKHWKKKKNVNFPLLLFWNSGIFHEKSNNLHTSFFLISGLNLQLYLSWFETEILSLTRSWAEHRRPQIFVCIKKLTWSAASNS